MNDKSRLEDLAVFGETPAFNEKVYVGRPYTGNREHFLRRVNDLLDRGWLTNNGPYVQEFEQKIAEMLSVKHCIAICNGTTALEIIIRALDLKGEVIVPSFTFIATAHALKWEEITPVFCDIDPKTFTIDAKKVEALITSNTTGIIGVHLWSRPCDVDALTKIARRRNLKLIFDAAHSFACSYKGEKIGNFGEAEIFSFHATKFFNTFEGGAIVTNNDDLAAKIRLMKNFGFSGYDNVVYLGTNGKMSEINAAVGLSNLESLSEFIETNRRNYHSYSERLAGIPGIELIPYDENEKCNYHYIVLAVNEKITQISRDLILKVLAAENVLTRRYFYPGCHRMEPYRSDPFYQEISLPITEKRCEEVLSLPSGTLVNEDNIRRICTLIETIVFNGSEIVRRLNSLTNKGF